MTIYTMTSTYFPTQGQSVWDPFKTNLMTHDVNPYQAPSTGPIVCGCNKCHGVVSGQSDITGPFKPLRHQATHFTHVTQTLILMWVIYCIQVIGHKETFYHHSWPMLENSRYEDWTFKRKKGSFPKAY